MGLTQEVIYGEIDEIINSRKNAIKGNNLKDSFL